MNQRGADGERAAAAHLQKLGYELVARGYRSRFGEIDIIVRDGSYLVFAEVKTRKRGALVGGLASVDRRKISRITKTAELFLAEHSFALQPRFDVIEIEDCGGILSVAAHIENAF